VPLDAEHRHDLDAIAAAVDADTALVVICNPNNPTSTAVSTDDLECCLEKIPSDVCVIVDEAYCEFNALDDPSASIRLLDGHPNVVLLRTFSKVYGLSGLRVGYALAGHVDLVDAVGKVRQPFGCNSLAQAAAIAALEDVEALDDRVRRNADSRVTLLRGLRELGLSPAESQANFAWFATGEDSMAAARSLREGNVFVSPGAPLGAASHLRVTFGTPDENARVLDALTAFMERTCR
jgi:histidinol-phosphate aminotransferase